jgi:hypothetical protein
VFTPIGSDGLAAFVARDGIWMTDMSSSPTPLTDKVDWDGRVDTMNLRTCRLVDDPRNRRMVFLYRRATDTTYNTGIWYLDYQEFSQRGVRIAFGDHGPLADAQTVASPDGKRTLVSIDARIGNGQVGWRACRTRMTAPAGFGGIGAVHDAHEGVHAGRAAIPSGPRGCRRCTRRASRIGSFFSTAGTTTRSSRSCRTRKPGMLARSC